MAGMARTAGRIESEPNVIPMIDVLLVMIVIFMLLNLYVRHVIPTQVPPPVNATPANAAPQIVLELLPSSGYAINGQPIADLSLDQVIGQIYRDRPSKLLFIKSAPDRTYQEVVTAMDRARGAGVEVIGIVPRGPRR